MSEEEEDINDYIYSTHEDLHFHIYPNGLAEFRLNRPKKLNTISAPFLSETLRILHILETLEEIQLIVLWSGDPKAWSAGGDVVQLTTVRQTSLQNHPLVKDKLAEMMSPSPSPLSIYNTNLFHQDSCNKTSPTQTSTISITSTTSSSNNLTRPVLFSGHIDPLNPGNDIPESAKPGLKLKTIPGFSASTLEDDPTMKPLLDFFHSEYSLLSLLSTYSKPSISLLSGISFGGGAGISMSTTIRLASMSTRFAMPETKIGLFPDVGSSYFYSQTPYGSPMGRFLGVTGYNLSGPEMMQLGLVDGVFAENQYHQVFGALRAVPKDTLKDIFTTRLPQILMQYANSLNTLHQDSLYLVKQEQKYQLQQLLLLISTYISAPKDGRPPSRLGLYLSNRSISYLSINTNPSYQHLHTQIHQNIEKQSFIFQNLSTILEIFAEPSYDRAVEEINNIVQFSLTPIPTLSQSIVQSSGKSKSFHPPIPSSSDGSDDQTTKKNTAHDDTDEANNNNNNNNNIEQLATNTIIINACHVIDDMKSSCAKELQKMLAPMCPASCILTYQMFSPLFARIVSAHKNALQDYQLIDDKAIETWIQKLHIIETKNNQLVSNNNNNTSLLTPLPKRPIPSYPTYHDYILQSDNAMMLAPTPPVLNRFIKPIHIQHFQSYFKKNPQILTTPTQSLYPTLTYTDYLSTEFILTARGSLGDFSNFNFFSGVSAQLLQRHKSPKWHLFQDILQQYRYLINDMYPMDMARGTQSLVSNRNDVRLFNEESFLLLNALPLSFPMPDLTLKYRHFWPQHQPEGAIIDQFDILRQSEQSEQSEHSPPTQGLSAARL